MPRRFEGLGVSPGIAVGRAHVLRSEPATIAPRALAVEAIDEECDRFESACLRADEAIRVLRDRVDDEIGPSYAAILDAQRLILADPGLRAETLARIRNDRLSAPWSLKQVVNGFLKRFAAIEDPYLRERDGDLTDVHRRLQRLLADRPTPESAIPEGPCIVVARSLGPSDAAVLARRGIAGIVTDTGGPTSHTAILAHALSVPAVAGLHDFSERVENGNLLIADGTTGVVTLMPDPEEELEARSRSAAVQATYMAAPEAGPAVTMDGETVVLRANIEFPQEIDAARRNGAAGIGLYRSEFLFLACAPELPTEEQHYRTYREILERSAPNPAVIRTLDLGGEKYFHEVLDRDEPNPVLGLRAVRLCLKRPDIFRPQLRGLLRASVYGDLRVMLPLVISAAEIRTVRGALRDEARRLRQAGIPYRDDIPLGIMIEVPAAAAAADLLAKQADFFSLGTNDLIQYALAVDRGNESVAHLYQPRHPGILRLMRFTVESAAEAGIPVSICGEMASDPNSLELLLGLGLRELSVQPGALGQVRERIGTTDTRQARRRLEALLGDSGLGEPSPYRIVR